MSADGTIRSIRDVMESNLDGAAHKEAMAHIGSHCYFCRQELADRPAIALYFAADRDPKHWGIHPYGPGGKVVTPGAFAHVECVRYGITSNCPTHGTY